MSSRAFDVTFLRVEKDVNETLLEAWRELTGTLRFAEKTNTGT